MQQETKKLAHFRAALRALGFEQDTHYALGRTGTTWQLRWLRPITHAQLTQAEHLLQTILLGIPG